MFRAHFRLAAVALVVLAAACSEGSTGPRPGALRQKTDKPSPKILLGSMDDDASRAVSEEIYDLSGSIAMLPCGEYGRSEEVAIEGKIFAKTQWIGDGNGGLHVTSSWMPIDIRGIGLESGAEYRITERENAVFNSTDMNQTSSFKYSVKWQAPSIGARGSWVIDARFMTNANGEIVVERSGLRAECSL